MRGSVTGKACETFYMLAISRGSRRHFRFSGWVQITDSKYDASE
jgi:hypothetical protein